MSCAAARRAALDRSPDPPPAAILFSGALRYASTAVLAPSWDVTPIVLFQNELRESLRTSAGTCQQTTSEQQCTAKHSATLLPGSYPVRTRLVEAFSLPELMVAKAYKQQACAGS